MSNKKACPQQSHLSFADRSPSPPRGRVFLLKRRTLCLVQQEEVLACGLLVLPVQQEALSS